MNSYLFSVISGIVQGLTEFLPVSSSGHLALLHNVFGFRAPHLAFDVLLHFGTLAAVAASCRKEVGMLIGGAAGLIKRVFDRGYRAKSLSCGERLCMLTAVSTLPLAAGAFIGDALSALAASTRAVGIMLMLNAAILSAGDAAAERTERRPLCSLDGKSAFLIGTLQLIAVAPGISRSGITAAGGIFAGLSREEAVRYSFLLSVPATLGANVLNIKDIAFSGTAPFEPLPAVAGMLAAALTGICAIGLIEKISRRTNFGVFAVYCFAAGSVACVFG